MGWFVLLAACFLVWALAVFGMRMGWRHRQQRQAALLGEMPSVPTECGAQLSEPASGVYVGSATTASWQDRVAVGDLGVRSKAELTRFDDGVLIDRTGESAIWIADDSIVDIRTTRALAGKVMGTEGLLAIRWRLPNGSEIDSGFRADDKSIYRDWVSGGTQ